MCDFQARKGYRKFPSQTAVHGEYQTSEAVGNTPTEYVPTRGLKFVKILAMLPFQAIFKNILSVIR